ncbi:hypothetical protein J6590_047009 [Homalodisca vitripennis]|nr:hypothetical protein J6590_047009 [Homalodisca vitripennis]
MKPSFTLCGASETPLHLVARLDPPFTPRGACEFPFTPRGASESPFTPRDRLNPPLHPVVRLNLTLHPLVRLKPPLHPMGNIFATPGRRRGTSCYMIVHRALSTIDAAACRGNECWEERSQVYIQLGHGY